MTAKFSNKNLQNTDYYYLIINNDMMLFNILIFNSFTSQIQQGLCVWERGGGEEREIEIDYVYK